MSYAGLKPCRSCSQSESWGWLQNMANTASAFEVSIALQWNGLSKGGCNTESTMAKHNANSWG